MARLSSIDQDVLTALEGRELYGLELLKAINLNRPYPQLKHGSLYPVLDRLEKKGLVEWAWGDDDSGGSRRKYYKITENGIKALREIETYRKILARRS